jgi:hypothetical protein
LYGTPVGAVARRATTLAADYPFQNLKLS